MHKQYGSDVQFYFIYTREAHAADSDRPTPIATVEQPVSTEERRKVAAEFVASNELEIPALLDNINDKTSNDYASLPDRFYLVGKDGKLVLSGQPGPGGFDPSILEKAIVNELAGKPPLDVSASQASGGRGGRGRGGRGGRGGGMERMRSRLAQMPIMLALDADGDGQVSAEEIAAAPKAIGALDKNGDGKITSDEMMPTRGGGGGRGRGRGR